MNTERLGGDSNILNRQDEENLEQADIDDPILTDDDDLEQTENLVCANESKDVRVETSSEDLIQDLLNYLSSNTVSADTDRSNLLDAGFDNYAITQNIKPDRQKELVEKYKNKLRQIKRADVGKEVDVEYKTDQLHYTTEASALANDVKNKIPKRSTLLPAWTGSNLSASAEVFIPNADLLSVASMTAAGKETQMSDSVDEVQDTVNNASGTKRAKKPRRRKRSEKQLERARRYKENRERIQAERKVNELIQYMAAAASFNATHYPIITSESVDQTMVHTNETWSVSQVFHYQENFPSLNQCQPEHESCNEENLPSQHNLRSQNIHMKSHDVITNESPITYSCDEAKTVISPEKFSSTIEMPVTVDQQEQDVPVRTRGFYFLPSARNVPEQLRASANELAYKIKMRRRRPDYHGYRKYSIPSY